MQSYQVGEIDENGFVCIGIEERKVPNVNNEKAARMVTGPGGVGLSDQGSDYSSSEEYSSGFSSDTKSHASKYKSSLDFLVEQGVRVRDLPDDSN